MTPRSQPSRVERASIGLVASGCLLVLACTGKSSASDAHPPANSLPTHCTAAIGAVDALQLDDFEDGDLLLNSAGNLRGVWYVTNDGTGEQLPAPGAEAGITSAAGSPESTLHALHTSGVGFTRWGAFAAAHFNAAQTHACTYDLSRYQGLRLSVKGEGNLRVNLGTVATTPVVDGGSCNTQTCSDYGESVPLDSEWQSVELPFAELEQPMWASTVPLRLSEALRISFWAERGDFDFWIDDLRFYP